MIGSGEGGEIVIAEGRFLHRHLLLGSLPVFLPPIGIVPLLLPVPGAGTLLLVGRVNGPPYKNLRRPLQRILHLASPVFTIAAVGFLLSFHLLHPGHSQFHILVKADPLKLHLLAEGGNQLLQKGEIRLIDGEVDILFIPSL